jgi:hypothetical protein
MEDIIKINCISELANYAPKDKIFEIERTKDITDKLDKYFNEQILLQFLALNGLYKKITKDKNDAFDLQKLPKDYKPHIVNYGGYKLKILN